MQQRVVEIGLNKEWHPEYIAYVIATLFPPPVRRLPRPRPAVSFSMILAVDDFTAENGATEVLAGSHLWDATTASEAVDLRGPLPRPVLMRAGSCLVFSGTLIHRGGANRSAAPRLAITYQYCQPWARTQENYFLSVPPERVRGMSPRVQQ